MSRNIVLFGMMAVGKSTAGRLVAERLGRQMLDTDEEIEAAAGRSVAEIFAAEGESGFRERERAAIAEATVRSDLVLAVGGGAVLDKTSLARLRGAGFLVHLSAPASVITDRLAAAPDEVSRRPLLDGDDPALRIEALLTERGPRYTAAADVEVDASRPADAVADDVVAAAVGAGDVLTQSETTRSAV